MELLLVEDDPRMARLVAEALVDASHQVTTVGDGASALALASARSYDVLILDVMLPALDGLTVCRRLRQGGLHTPILVLTARDAIADRVRGLDAGADDYLIKPFALVELLARVRALGRRGEAAPDEHTVQVADLTLDLAAHTAQRGERTMELTARECRLLEYLLRHAGQVLTREQISAAVWGYEADLSSNVVETYIHYLRDKIDRGFARPLLRTVRGVGYTIRT